jgi:hypothetical protein
LARRSKTAPLRRAPSQSSSKRRVEARLIARKKQGKETRSAADAAIGARSKIGFCVKSIPSWRGASAY